MVNRRITTKHTRTRRRSPHSHRRSNINNMEHINCTPPTTNHRPLLPPIHMDIQSHNISNDNLRHNKNSRNTPLLRVREVIQMTKLGTLKGMLILHNKKQKRLSQMIREGEWLLELYEECNGDFYCMIDKAQTIEELLTIHGYIESVKGYSECKKDYGINEDDLTDQLRGYQ